MRRMVLWCTAFILAVGSAAHSQIANDHHVLIEEFTGAWCGYCPDGAITLDSLCSIYPQIIPVSIHAGSTADSMIIYEGQRIAGGLTYSFPTAAIDRVEWNGLPAINREEWGARVADRLAEAPVATVRIDRHYNPQSRELTAVVEVQFLSVPPSASMRLNLYVIEDSVVGNGDGYDQTNYHNDDAWHPLYKKGNPVAGYVHRHVLRAVPSGIWGTEGVIPSDPMPGTIYSQTYHYTVPDHFRAEQMSLVGFASRHDTTRTKWRIIGSAERRLIEPPSGVGAGTGNHTASLAIAPMPVRSAGVMTLTLPSAGNVTVELHDLLGRTLKTLSNGPLTEGVSTIAFDASDLGSGVYWVHMTAGEHHETRRIVVVR